MESGDWADASRAPRGNPAGQEADGEEQTDDRHSGERVVGGYAPKLADDGPRDGEADEDANDDARDNNSEAMFQNHLKNIGRCGAESHADADFVGTARGGIGDHAIDAEGHEKQANRGKRGDKKKAEARLCI